MFDQERLEKEVENVVKWVKDFVDNTGAKGVVIGNSGGKDCATVIAISEKALGRERVITAMLPCSTIVADVEDAKLVADKFGVPLLNIDLNEAYQHIEKNMNNELKKFELAEGISKEGSINMKPRLRMATLYSIAHTMGYLVIGTGNLCEKTVGYTTKWGDNVCDFNPIANFTVEEVLQIGEYLEVPEKIIKKDPNDGLGGLTDEQKLGVTYKQIAEYIIEGKTDKEAKEKIDKLYKNSIHKRRPIHVYEVKDRINNVEIENGV